MKITFERNPIDWAKGKQILETLGLPASRIRSLEIGFAVTGEVVATVVAEYSDQVGETFLEILTQPHTRAGKQDGATHT